LITISCQKSVYYTYKIVSKYRVIKCNGAISYGVDKIRIVTKSALGNEMVDLGKSVGNKNKGGEVKDFG